ncbi:hypothetical protein [Azospirillum tabaci]|uniref:hypothetical protein n=1 Tax=Azospirillum tabaci TaxID=2752310 RepID=UPI0016606EC7|nr:hypothetical protein [Azospirillum tabaci]
MIDGLRLRWRRCAGMRVADWRGRHLSVESDRLGPFRWDHVWCIGRDCAGRDSVEVFGFASTFATGQRAAEAAMAECLTGHERAQLARVKRLQELDHPHSRCSVSALMGDSEHIEGTVSPFECSDFLVQIAAVPAPARSRR